MVKSGIIIKIEGLLVSYLANGFLGARNVNYSSWTLTSVAYSAVCHFLVGKRLIYTTYICRKLFERSRTETTMATMSLFNIIQN